MNSIGKLGSNTLIYGLGSSLQKFISLILLPIFTHYITPAEYGVIAMISIITMVTIPIFSLGFGTSIGVFYFQSRSLVRKDSTIWTSFFILLFSVVILLVIVHIFSLAILQIIKVSAEYENLLFVAIYSSVFMILATPFLLKLQFEQKVKQYVVINFLSTFFIGLLSYILVVKYELGVHGLIISQMIGNLLLFTGLIMINMNSNMSYNKKLQKKLLSLGVSMIPSFAFLFLLMHSNKYIFQLLNSDLETLGVYSIGFSIGSVMSLVTSAIATAWFPFFMSYINKPKEAEIVFGKVFTYYVLIVGFITLQFFIFAKPITLIFLDEKFYEAYKVIGLIAATYFVIGMFNMFLPGIYFAKKVSYVSVVQGTSALIVVVVGYYILISENGLAELSLIVFIGHSVMSLLLFTLNKTNQQINLKIKYEYKIVILTLIFIMILSILSIFNDDISRNINYFYLFIYLLLMVASFVLVFYYRKKIFNYYK